MLAVQNRALAGKDEGETEQEGWRGKARCGPFPPEFGLTLCVCVCVCVCFLRGNASWSGPVEKRKIREVPSVPCLEGLPDAAPTPSPWAGACQVAGVREQDGAPQWRARCEGVWGQPSLTPRRWLLWNPDAANSLGSGVLTAFLLWVLHFWSRSAPHIFLMMSPILTSYILKVDL